MSDKIDSSSGGPLPPNVVWVEREMEPETVIDFHINVPSGGYVQPKNRRALAGEVFRKLNQPKPSVHRISVDKRTHQIRFENETEDEVTIVIEPKGERWTLQI
jgi:hypothetical protein